jgi:heptosyltransferase I
MTEMLSGVRHVSIVLLTGLGDVVMGLPIAEALRAHDPTLRITWIAEPMPAGILAHHPAIDRVVVYHKKRGARGIADLRRDLAGERIDLTLNLNIYFKSLWPTILSGAPRRLGFGRGRARDGVWLASNRHLPAGPRRHTVDLFLGFLEYLGLPAEPRWRLPFSDAEQSARRDFFREIGAEHPTVAVVPASGIAAKDWTVEGYARVVDALERDFGYRVLLVGGPGEREQRMAREITEHAATKPVWALGDGVRRLAWTLSGCDLVVAPDTGPVHIARALEVPVVGLYGHTNPWRVGPYRWCEDLWVDRYTEPGAAPDPSLFDPKQGRMQQITPDEVLEKVARATERYVRPRRAQRSSEGVEG